MTPTRLEAFSDGVLAIIITIMVIELKVLDGHTLSALWHTTGTSLLTYLLSFVNVGIYWNNHHHMFHVVKEVSSTMLWANLALLFCLSLFPFTTAWLAASHVARMPAAVYGVDLLAAAVTYFVVQLTIFHAQGPNSTLRLALGPDVKGKLSPLLYLAGVASALVFGQAHWGVWLSVAFYVVVALMWLVPDRRIARQLRDHRSSSAESADE